MCTIGWLRLITLTLSCREVSHWATAGEGESGVGPESIRGGSCMFDGAARSLPDPLARWLQGRNAETAALPPQVTTSMSMSLVSTLIPPLLAAEGSSPSTG